jgi:phosphoribosylformylglycinamidine synthase
LLIAFSCNISPFFKENLTFAIKSIEAKIMKFGVVVFPGSNCDDDMVHVLGTVMGQQVEKIWHKETELKGWSPEDCIVLPGGFSYGDYLRAGAIASQSPIIGAVRAFAEAGGCVLGICNGFQILCEMGLLPGVLLRNRDQKFISKNVYLRVESSDSILTRATTKGKVLRMPVAHAEGRYYASATDLERLRERGHILFTYSTAEGAHSEESNINGSLEHIAGIRNDAGNVIGMMPHPERASEMLLGCEDGKVLFESLLAQA